MLIPGHYSSYHTASVKPLKYDFSVHDSGILCNEYILGSASERGVLCNCNHQNITLKLDQINRKTILSQVVS